MLSTRVLVLLASCLTVFCEDSILSPCEVSDTECLRKSTQSFLAKTAGGVPQYDIKQIDPLVIPSLDILFDEELGMWAHLKNLNVVGLKNQELSAFSLDKEKKDVELQTKLDLIISGDITLEAKKKEKSLSGSVSIKGSALGKANYQYTEKVDDKGVAHFDVGPEKISCEAIGDAVLDVNPELKEALGAAADIKAEREKWVSHSKENINKMLCSVVENAYVTVVHNIRATAKVLPKDSFFKDL